jgi:hypothetical protein
VDTSVATTPQNNVMFANNVITHVLNVMDLIAINVPIAQEVKSYLQEPALLLAAASLVQVVLI